MTHTCDFCDSPDVAEVVYEEKVSVGRRRILLSDVRKMECPACGHEYVTSEQLAHNHARFDAVTSVAAGQVFVGLLRSIRERWMLSQRVASHLFGAGESSFAKWESGQLPSGPTALLIQCAAHVPGVVEFLARMQNATLPSCPELADWNSDTGEVTGKMAILEKLERPSPPVQRVRGIPNYAELVYHPEEVIRLYGKVA